MKKISSVENVLFYQKIYDALSTISPVPIEFVKSTLIKDGEYNSHKQVIYIHDGMSQTQTMKVCFREVVRAIYYSEDLKDENDGMEKEREIESIVFLICKDLGVDAPRPLGECEEINRKADEIINRMEATIRILNWEEFEKEITEDCEYFY